MINIDTKPVRSISPFPEQKKAAAPTMSPADEKKYRALRALVQSDAFPALCAVIEDLNERNRQEIPGQLQHLLGYLTANIMRDSYVALLAEVATQARLAPNDN